ncbi:MAG: hypothetical protein K1000chlam3_00082 [Chlamydiae bacterium]|nr:hypothetical protein [Chlamydiota bacterium]
MKKVPKISRNAKFNSEKVSKGILSLIFLYVITTIYIAFLSPNWLKLLETPLIAGGLISVVMWFPGIIGLLFAKNEGITLKVFAWPNRYFFLGPLFILLLILLAFVVSLPFVEVRNLEKLNLIHAFGILAGGYLLSLTGSMLFSLGEELYWRGYLWEKLRKFSPIRAIVIMGVLWGIWHWPFLIFLSQYVPKAPLLGTIYPNFPLIGCLLVLFNTVLLSFLFTYFRLKGKAIMASAAMHGMASLGISFAWAVYASPVSFLIGMTGITSFVIAFLFCLFFKLFSPNTWKKLV